MFISTKEKEFMSQKIDSLDVAIKSIYASLRIIEGQLQQMKTAKKEKTPAQRKAQREYMRAYKARKLAEKKAEQAVA